MSKRTTVRIPDELYQWLVERAAREHRTVSNLLVALLSETRKVDPIGLTIGSQASTDANQRHELRD